MIGEPLVEQLDIWERSLIDVEVISRKLEAVQKDNDKLRDKILLLERKVQVSLKYKKLNVDLYFVNSFLDFARRKRCTGIS